MSAQPIVRKALRPEDVKKVYSIRRHVFVREQGVPPETELDSDDRRAIHLIAEIDRKTVGTARLLLKRNQAKIGRMAVLKRYRGRGIGTQLLKRALGVARRKGAKIVFLHAQVPVIPFYEKMGFRCVGQVFVEAGIPHRKMVASG